MTKEINVDGLSKSLVRLFNISSTMLHDRFSGSGLIGERKLLYVIESPSQISAREELRPNFKSSLSLIRADLIKSPEFKKVQDIILSEPKIKNSVNRMVEFHGGWLRFTDEELIFSTLSAIHENSENETKTKLAVVNALISLAEFYQSETVRNKGVVYLENVEIDRKNIAFSEDIVLQVLSRNEMVELYNTDKIFESKYGFSAPIPMINVNSMLQFSFASKLKTIPYNELDNSRQSPREDPKILNDVTNALHSFRILGKGILSTSDIYILRYYSPFDYYVESKRFSSGRIGHSITLRFEEGVLQEVLDLYSVLSKLQIKNAEYIALMRLEKFGSRESLEDQLLDLFIGLEAIVFGAICEMGKDRGELTFRLSSLVAKYLATNFQERVQISDRIKEGYILRSKIVHGIKLKKTTIEKQLSELIELYKTLLLKWFLDRSNNREPNEERLLFN